MKMKWKAGIQFGKWTLVKRLGQGGNGVVWKVEPSGAIKFLKPGFFRNKKRYARFKDEVEAMRQCQNVTGVLPLLDSNLPDTPSDENPAWLVSGLATPLPKIIDEHTSLRVAVEICASIAQTLQILHERGISHRDIKPDNLFSFEGQWTIGDFGLANYPDKAAITGAREKVGPAFFIAPEMLNDAANADGRPADVYSLAKTLWVLSTGQNFPLPGEQRIDDPAYRISTYAPEPQAQQLDVLGESATRLDPSRRPTMSDFASELRAWLEPRQTTMPADDISDLRGNVYELVGAHLREQRQRSELERKGKMLLRQLYPYLEEIEQKLREIDLVISSNSVSSNLFILEVSPPKCRAPEQKRAWSGGGAVVVSMKNHDKGKLVAANTFWCGSGVDYTDEGMTFLIMGYAVRKFRLNLQGERVESRRLLWHDCAQFVAGGPKEKNAIARLGTGLHQNLRPAVKSFLEMISED